MIAALVKMPPKNEIPFVATWIGGDGVPISAIYKYDEYNLFPLIRCKQDKWVRCATNDPWANKNAIFHIAKDA